MGRLPESFDYQSLRFLADSDGRTGLIIQGLGGGNGKSVMTLMLPTPSVFRPLADKVAFDVPAPAEAIDIKPLLESLAQPIPPISLGQVHRGVEQVLRNK